MAVGCSSFVSVSLGWRCAPRCVEITLNGNGIRLFEIVERSECGFDSDSQESNDFRSFIE